MDRAKVRVVDLFINYIIKGLVFLLPLFFLPGTGDYFGPSKQLLLWLLIPLAAYLFYWRQSSLKRLIIIKTPLDIPVLIFLVAIFLSAIFSIDKLASWFGYYGEYSLATWNIIFLVLWYFILTNVIAGGRLTSIAILKILALSYGAVVIITLASLFFPINILPTYHTLGNSQIDLIVFLTGANVLFWGLALAGSRGLRRGWRWLFLFFNILSFGLLLFTEAGLAWIFMGAGLFVWFLIRGRKDRNKSLITGGTIFLIIIFLLLAVFPLNFLKINKNLVQEQLGYSGAIEITKGTIKEKPIFGSGPGTFIYNFSSFRPADMNYSPDWQIRFKQAPAYVLEIAGGSGIMGLASYFLLLFLLFYFIFWRWRIEEQSNIITSLKASLITIIFIQFVYPANINSLFLFWLIVGLLMAEYTQTLKNSGLAFTGEKKIILGKKMHGLFSSFLILLAVGWIFLLVVGVKYWLGDFFYNREKNESNISKAVNLNPHNLYYRVGLVKYYLREIDSELNKKQPSRDYSLMQINITKGIAAGQEAITYWPRSVLAHETLAMFYRDTRLLTKGSELWTLKHFQSASELEPSNPVLLAEISWAYFNLDQLLEANLYFKKALELKSDYYDAEFGLAKVAAKEGNEQAALAILEKLESIHDNTEVYYELGRLYYNQGQTSEAAQKFLTLINIIPNHANALYSLGLAYEKLGDYEEARNYFTKVLELNPDNEEVKKRIGG